MFYNQSYSETRLIESKTPKKKAPKINKLNQVNSLSQTFKDMTDKRGVKSSDYTKDELTPKK